MGFPTFDSLSQANERSIAALEPAWGKAALFFRTGHRFGHPKGSLRAMSLVKVHERLAAYHKRCADGDTLSILHAISICAQENLPLPQWLAEAFQERLEAFLKPGALTSLDQAFSSTSLPTNSVKKAAAARQDWQLGVTLWHRAWELTHSDDTLASIDAVVTRLLVADDYGVAKTKAKALISMIDRNQSELLARDQSLSQFLAKRRKRMT